MRPSSGIQPHFDSYSASLTFRNVDLSDAGTYVCEAFNANGRVKTTAVLTVLG